jgi:hypothetical protein
MFSRESRWRLRSLSKGADADDATAKSNESRHEKRMKSEKEA